MKFPYLKLPSLGPNLKWIVRPYIPIRLTGPKGFWEGYSLIDSGADRSLFNLQIAEKIGLDLIKGLKEKFGGIEGGTIQATLKPVRKFSTPEDQEIREMQRRILARLIPGSI